MSRRALLAAAGLTMAVGCGRREGARDPLAEPSSRAPRQVPRASAPPVTDARMIAGRATVPVLCWHQLRDWRASDSTYDRSLLICPPSNFRAQLDAIVAAGYTTIGPDRYLAHLTSGEALPPKPVLLTFDDAQGSQITAGLPELRRRRLTATFFVMTVVLGKRNWMSRNDLRALDQAGMTVAAHTYDHHRVDRYTGTDWAEQLTAPRAELESILGKPVRHFAYPYGAWSGSAFSHLRQAGYLTAFQLSDQPMDPGQPLYTLRRVLVDSTWTGAELVARLRG